MDIIINIIRLHIRNKPVQSQSVVRFPRCLMPSLAGLCSELHFVLSNTILMRGSSIGVAWYRCLAWHHECPFSGCHELTSPSCHFVDSSSDTSWNHFRFEAGIITRTEKRTQKIKRNFRMKFSEVVSFYIEHRGGSADISREGSLDPVARHHHQQIRSQGTLYYKLTIASNQFSSGMTHNLVTLTRIETPDCRVKCGVPTIRGCLRSVKNCSLNIWQQHRIRQGYFSAQKLNKTLENTSRTSGVNTVREFALREFAFPVSQMVDSNHRDIRSRCYIRRGFLDFPFPNLKLIQLPLSHLHPVQKENQLCNKISNKIH